MTAAAETVGSGWGLSEIDLFAGRIDGSVAPLLPTDVHNLAIEEALTRFGPGNEDIKQPTRFSRAEIGRWYAASPEPSLAVTLIAAHKLQTGERRSLFDGGKGQAELFNAVSGRIRTRYGVNYNNNPRDNTGPEERSLSAWLLAESLVQLCDGGRVQPGCEPLAENIVDKLLGLYVQKIRIAMPAGANDTRPAGIELLDLCEQLNGRGDAGTTIQIFVEAPEQPEMHAPPLA